MIKTEDVKKYISNLREAEENTTVPFCTGCSTLDALLSTKSSLLKENNIQISCLVHFTNSDFLSPMELCTLFANSLDNAIEAVLPLPVENRFIRISGGEVNGNMVVRIENPYHHTLHRAGDRFISTKSDDHFHGYGLANMRKIIEAHNGTLTYKTENHIFSLFFMIPFPN